MAPEFVDIIGFAAGAFTTLASLPQLIKAIRTKEVGDVSVKMFLVLITGVSLWTVYGIMKHDLAIIIANGISVAINLTLLFLIFYYRR